MTRAIMTRYLQIACTATLAIGGCSMDGSWQAISIDPPDASFPMRKISFDDQGRFTSTSDVSPMGYPDGKTRTSTGKYRLAGSRLHLETSTAAPISYSVRRRFDGKLVLTFTSPDKKRKVAAVFERVEESPNP